MEQQRALEQRRQSCFPVPGATEEKSRPSRQTRCAALRGNSRKRSIGGSLFHPSETAGLSAVKQARQARQAPK